MRMIRDRTRLPLALVMPLAKRKLVALTVRVDGCCRRMNYGLGAVAVVLALVLIATIALRGAELMSMVVDPASLAVWTSY